MPFRVKRYEIKYAEYRNKWMHLNLGNDKIQGFEKISRKQFENDPTLVQKFQKYFEERQNELKRFLPV